MWELTQDLTDVPNSLAKKSHLKKPRERIEWEVEALKLFGMAE